jgi:hypothetical protein
MGTATPHLGSYGSSCGTSCTRGTGSKTTTTFASTPSGALPPSRNSTSVGLSLASKPPKEISPCSNRAATQVNIGKARENRLSENALICRNFASSRNVGQCVVLLLQGGGRWFKSSIAHLEKAAFCSINVRAESRWNPCFASSYTSSTPTRRFSHSLLVALTPGPRTVFSEQCLLFTQVFHGPARATPTLWK